MRGQRTYRPCRLAAAAAVQPLATTLTPQAIYEKFLSCLGVPFPRNFLSVAKTILKRLFRVYAHVYHQHRDDVRRLDEEAHLNTSFKHFIFFIEEFSLIDKKELTPLQDLIDVLNAKDQRM